MQQTNHSVEGLSTYYIVFK